jgi:hypothetical protein
MSTEITPGTPVFLVKYAVSRKGEPQDATVKTLNTDGTVQLNEWYGFYKVGRDVALTRKDADNIILGLLAKKIGQVQKQLAALQGVRDLVDARARRGT